MYVVYIFSINTQNTLFSRDSWAIFELSKTIFTDFYKSNTIRQYEFITYYSISFPPLYPFLLSLLNLFLPYGIYNGYLFNLLVTLLILFLLIIISNQLFEKNIFISLIIFLLLFLNKNYQYEAFGARTIPLQILLNLLILYLLISKKRFNYFIYALIGILMGLNLLNRFDAMIQVFIMFLFLFFLDSNRSLKKGLIYFLTLLVTIFPWIFYSTTHFNSFFISDNRRTVFLAIDSTVNSFYENTQSLPSLLNSPLIWLNIIEIRIDRFLTSFSIFFFKESPLFLIFLFYVFSVTGFIFFNKNIFKNKKVISSDSRVLFIRLFSFFIAVSSNIVLLLLTGYGENRYLLNSYLFFLLLTFYIFYIIYYSHRSLLGKYTLLFFCFGLFINSFLYLFRSVKNLTPFYKDTYPFEMSRGNLNYNEYYPESLYLSTLPYTPVILAGGGIPDDHALYPDKFGALTGFKVIILPSNYTVENSIYLSKKYQVNHLFTNDTKLVVGLNSRGYNFKSTGIPDLYFLDEIIN